MNIPALVYIHGIPILLEIAQSKTLTDVGLTDVGLASLLGTDVFRWGIFSGLGIAAPTPANGLLLVLAIW